MSTPANATEAPSIDKVWQQVKNNVPTFATVWVFIFVVHFLNLIASSLFFLLRPVEPTGWVALGPVLLNLEGILMGFVAAVYYATDHCPRPGEILEILSQKPRRYLLAFLLLAMGSGIGHMLCVVPGILLTLVTPIYIHHVFTTDVGLITCLSKSFKIMFLDFGPFLVVSILCALACIVSFFLCVFPVLAVLPMATLYMQNYIHHKGLVSA